MPRSPVWHTPDTDLTLVGVVDDHRAGLLFDVPISRLEHLSAETIGGVPCAHVVVMSVRHADSTRARLHESPPGPSRQPSSPRQPKPTTAVPP